MPISASDIQVIAAKEDDFGHELRVGAAVRSILGFEVQHSGTYTDDVTGKPRQFDYRCWLSRPAPMSLDRHTANLFLAVECKNLNPDFPLVICGTERRGEEAYHELIVNYGDGVVSQQLGTGPFSLTRRADAKRSFYPPGDFVGKTLLRLKPEKPNSTVGVVAPDSDVYERWAQALASGLGLAKAACDVRQGCQVIWSAILPVVVVSNNSLWRMGYDDDGKIASPPERVEQCDFYVARRIWAGDQNMFTFSHIHFFTLTGFQKFLTLMADANKPLEWERLFNPGLLRFGK
jgi:hypothetical protein